MGKIVDREFFDDFWKNTQSHEIHGYLEIPTVGSLLGDITESCV
jgi:hypothetical protein